jgi:hypothetical protein
VVTVFVTDAGQGAAKMAVLATPWRVTCLRCAPFRQKNAPARNARAGAVFFIDFRAGVLKARGAHVN